MKTIHIPVFEGSEAKQQLYKFLKENKNALTAQKKNSTKEASPVSYACPVWDEKDKSFKATGGVPVEALLIKDQLMVKLAINATNLFDNHGDVHFPGIWKKNLKEVSGSLLHLQEHKDGFQFVIAEGLDGDVKASTEMMKWKDLGMPYKGESEVLVFNSVVKKARNPFMFDQYAKGYVKNHSVSMRYIKVAMAINSEEKYYREEKDTWDTYYDEIANKADVDEVGYFWAVTEAQAKEGSAVVRGSNWATPTLETKSDEPVIDHSKDLEPGKSTPIDYSYLSQQFKNNFKI